LDSQVQVLVGAQWGDEGKGRVVDVLAETADVVARYQGGANAGHTVMAGGRKYVFHLLPSGMLYPNRLCVIGNGLVVDPEKLIEEINGLDPSPEMLGTRLVVSGAAHVVMPYHKKLDALRETARSQSGSASAIGTTGRGIGPCYVDKYNRTGIRMEDLTLPDVVASKLRLNLSEKNQILEKIYGESPFEFDKLYETVLEWGRFIGPYIGNVTFELGEAISSGKRILFEGAQGTLLDIDYGTYPYVTSSNCISGGCCTGGAVPPGRIGKVIGVAKAYCTRVGGGPFPTELTDAAGERLREKGREFGATTGRPRRCGWLDMVALNYAVRVNGLDAIALTKLDILSGFDELLVCVAYEIDGDRSETFPDSSNVLERATPVYRRFPSWNEDISGCRSVSDLPKPAREYVGFIEESTSTKVCLIGVGPERENTIRIS
jgi:adenylosuccinate synthase